MRAKVGQEYVKYGAGRGQTRRLRVVAVPKDGPPVCEVIEWPGKKMRGLRVFLTADYVLERKP
jgi:hypothetical protein